MRIRVLAAGLPLVTSLCIGRAHAQQPYPAAPPYPQQQPPQQPYPAPPYPQQQQPYPAAPPYPQQQPPQQPYPATPYPQQQQQPYPAQQPYSPGAAPQPPVPPVSRFRTSGEMAFLYGTSIAYGIGTGVWLDALTKTSDPGIAFIAPALLGAAVPIAMYAWDQAEEFDRAVPSTMATGLLLGAALGVGIDGLQWQATGNGGPNSWDFRSNASVVFLGATAGGIGGYVFGELTSPSPRSLAFIASGAGWGALTGILLGSGVVSRDWKDGAAPWGFAGTNLGIVATGALSTVYVPSWQSIQYMWLGQALGILATTPVYLFYIGNGDEAQHGLIANAVGGLAGLSLAAVLTANMADPPGTASWHMPFQLVVSPEAHGGAALQAAGAF